MLGDQAYDTRGKYIGMRVLPDGKIEQTGTAKGKFYGEDVTATFTGETELRPDGTGYMEVRGFFTTASGAMGRFKGVGNVVIKPDGTRVSTGAICYTMPPGKYAKLNGMAVVWEVEVDKEGNFTNNGWEWK